MASSYSQALPVYPLTASGSADNIVRKGSSTCKTTQPGHSRTLEMACPVVWRLAVPLSIVLGRLPDIPVSEGVVLGLSGLLEPFVLVARMVDNEVEHHLHPTLMELICECIHIRDMTISRVNFIIVADVVSLGASLSACPSVMATAQKGFSFDVPCRSGDSRRLATSRRYRHQACGDSRLQK